LRDKYLLPCSCGKKIAVEPRQAGQAVRCACGKSVTAPTLLQLTHLERAEAVVASGVEAEPPTWGMPQRLLLVGAFVLLAVLIGAVFVVRSRPEPLFTSSTSELVHREVEQWPASWVLGQFWQIQEKGIDWGARSTRERYDQALARYHLWLGASLVFGLLGVGLLVGGIAYPRPSSCRDR
jgi:hypothetical protein